MNHPPNKTIIKGAAAILTMAPDLPRIDGGHLIIENTWISAVGGGAPPDVQGARVIDANGQIVMPGMINTHHHLYQTLTRCVPEVQDAELFDWLKRLYPIWARIGDGFGQVDADLRRRGRQGHARSRNVPASVDSLRINIQGRRPI